MMSTRCVNIYTGQKTGWIDGELETFSLIICKQAMEKRET